MAELNKENWTGETKNEKPQIRLSYRFEDVYGQRFGEFETNELGLIENPTAEKAVYFNGSVESPYGDFIIECKVKEAQKIIDLIADFVKKNDELKELEKNLAQASEELRLAEYRFREKGESPNYELTGKVFDLEERIRKLKISIKIIEEKLEPYKL